MATSHHVQITTPDLRDMSRPDEIDPDISATLADFLPYTEYLPSAVARSLSLIKEQDRIARGHQRDVHHLLTTYSQLPKSSPDVRNEAATLRDQISISNARLQSARHMAAAEARRLSDAVARDYQRLRVVTRRLKSMPIPPSRDPTPDPDLDPDPVLSPRLTHTSADKSSALYRSGDAAAKVRDFDVVVPGEVLPPIDLVPSSMIEAGESDSSDELQSPPRRPIVSALKDRVKLGNRHMAPRPSNALPPQAATPKRSRDSATGAHMLTMVSNMSTSSAISALVPPPDDAKLGSKWLPWERITEYELAKLRKRMKKNAAWWPSEVMQARELVTLGRGTQAKEDARARAQFGGDPFMDECGVDWEDPTRATVNQRSNGTSIVSTSMDPASPFVPDKALISASQIPPKTENHAHTELSAVITSTVSSDNAETQLGTKPSLLPALEFVAKASSAATSSDEAAKTIELRETNVGSNSRPSLSPPKVAATKVAEDVSISPPRKRKRDSSTPSRQSMGPTVRGSTSPHRTRLSRSTPAAVDLPPVTMADIASSQASTPLEKVASPQATTTSSPIKLRDRSATPARQSSVLDSIQVASPRQSFRQTPAPGTVPAASCSQRASRQQQPTTARVNISPVHKRKREATPAQAAESVAIESQSPDPLANSVPPTKKLRLSVPSKSISAEPSDVPSSTIRVNANSSELSDHVEVAVSKQQNTSPLSSPTPTVDMVADFDAALPRKATRQSLRAAQAESIKSSPRPLAAPSRRTSLRRETISVQSEQSEAAPQSASRTRASKTETAAQSKRDSRTRAASQTQPNASRTAIRASTGDRRKSGGSRQQKSNKQRHSEELSDSEEGYPYCSCNRSDETGDQMVECDGMCEDEWFHFRCVGLKDLPKRNAQWYCPRCRVLFGISKSADGSSGQVEAGFVPGKNLDLWRRRKAGERLDKRDRTRLRIVPKDSD